jgi:hypothetical protein
LAFLKSLKKGFGPGSAPKCHGSPTLAETLLNFFFYEVLAVLLTLAMLDIKQHCHQDNVDCPPSLDKEGLELAFKYFSSTTLTMRLCGINQGT